MIQLPNNSHDIEKATDMLGQITLGNSQIQDICRILVPKPSASTAQQTTIRASYLRRKILIRYLLACMSRLNWMLILGYRPQSWLKIRFTFRLGLCLIGEAIGGRGRKVNVYAWTMSRRVCLCVHRKTL